MAELRVYALPVKRCRHLFLMQGPPAVDYQKVTDDHIRQVARQKQHRTD
jgi:hypothetical protein